MLADPRGMKMFCCYTPAHEVLFSKYLQPTVPPSFSLTPIKLEIPGMGDFLGPDFLLCIARKTELVLESIRANPGQVIVWSDVDVQFFELDASGLSSHLGPSDIAFQREEREPRLCNVNTGFFVCRCNKAVESLFVRVSASLDSDRSINEQYAVNHLLRQGFPGLSWTYLPPGFYARTHGWPPPRRLALYHANATAGPGGVERKIQQFNELAFLRRYGPLGLAITSARHAPKRLLRLLTGRRS